MDVNLSGQMYKRKSSNRNEGLSYKSNPTHTYGISTTRETLAKIIRENIPAAKSMRPFQSQLENFKSYLKLTFKSQLENLTLGKDFWVSHQPAC